MKPEEINKAIAEKVMGWCYHDVVQNDYGKHCKKCLLPLLSLIEEPDMNFSTEIHAAWQVVEKMLDPGLYKLKLEFIGMIEDPAWEAKFITVHSRPFVVGEVAKTPSMAICLAALKAIS